MIGNRIRSKMPSYSYRGAPADQSCYIMDFTKDGARACVEDSTEGACSSRRTAREMVDIRMETCVYIYHNICSRNILRYGEGIHKSDQ